MEWSFFTFPIRLNPCAFREMQHDAEIVTNPSAVFKDTGLRFWLFLCLLMVNKIGSVMINS